MFYFWNELGVPPTGGRGDGRSTFGRRCDSRSVRFWIYWKGGKFQVLCIEGKPGGFGQIFFDENTLENEWGKQHLAEKSVGLNIIPAAHLCNIIQQGTQRRHENDFQCEKSTGILNGRRICSSRSLFRVKSGFKEK